MSDAVQGAIELGVFLLLIVLVGLGMRGRLSDETLGDGRRDDEHDGGQRGAAAARHRATA